MMASTASTSSSITTLLPQQNSPGDLVRFFQAYDSLQREASTLTTDQQALNEAQSKHRELANQLKWTTSSIDFNKDFIKEQKDRIDLVSTHWFYGRTLFQPQLWLRGGCQGKIDRAKVKLLKAVEDHPKLEQAQQNLQEMEAVARDYAHTRQAAFGRSFEADAEVRRMHEELVQKHPTHKLRQLEYHESELHQSIGEQEQLKTLLEIVGDKLRSAKRCASNVESKVQSAQKKTEKADQLAQEQVFLSWEGASKSASSTTTTEEGGTEVYERYSIEFDSYIDCKKYDDEGNLVLTNHPCPRGCGYVVTWEGIYCCSACSNPENKGQRHGRRCEHVPISSQTGAQELWDLLQKQREDHQTKVEDTKREASEDVECAVAELQSGLELIQGASATLASPILCALPNVVASRTSNENQRSMLRVQAHQLEAAVKEQETVLEQRRQNMEGKCFQLEQQLGSVGIQIGQEKNAIFDSVRASVQPPNPSKSNLQNELPITYPTAAGFGGGSSFQMISDPTQTLSTTAENGGDSSFQLVCDPSQSYSPTAGNAGVSSFQMASDPPQNLDQTPGNNLPVATVTLVTSNSLPPNRSTICSFEVVHERE